jgi:hypothetical protein
VRALDGESFPFETDSLANFAIAMSHFAEIQGNGTAAVTALDKTKQRINKTMTKLPPFSSGGARMRGSSLRARPYALNRTAYMVTQYKLSPKYCTDKARYAMVIRGIDADTKLGQLAAAQHATGVVGALVMPPAAPIPAYVPRLCSLFNSSSVEGHKGLLHVRGWQLFLGDGSMLAVPECSSRLDQRQQGRPRILRYEHTFLRESDEHFVQGGKAGDCSEI